MLGTRMLARAASRCAAAAAAAARRPTTATMVSQRARAFGARAVVVDEDIGLNWSLVDDDITPMGNAFRNASTRALIQRADGTHGPNKSLAIGKRSDPVGPADADVVADALSNVEDVFVVDAAAGSYRGSEVLVRAVTDDAAVALFLQHLLVRTGGASTSETGSAHPIKVFHSASAGPAGLSSTVGELGATIVATGDIAFGHLQEAITQATHALMATGEGEFDVLPLPASAYVNDKSGAVTLQINAGGDRAANVAKPKKGSSLYGAHAVVWSQAGLARIFGGAVVDGATAKALGAPRKGDVVVDGSTVVTSFAADNLVAHPSEVVFVGAGKKGGIDSFAKVARMESEIEKFAKWVDQFQVKVSSR